MRGNQPLHIPVRTIMTPGPVEVDPRVRQAMSHSILGQFDPAFTSIMNETMQLLREVLQTKNEWAFPIDGTSRAGIEAMLCSVIEEGDKVLIPCFGRFGYLLKEITERCGAEVTIIEKEWGQVFEPEEIIRALKKEQPKILAMVHGDTSTGRMQPLQEIGKACRELDILFIVDAVATVGGTDVKTDEWFIDGLITGTQKCLSVPSGMAPLTYNERVENILKERKSIEQGLITERSEVNVKRRIKSNYFDLSQLQDYWSPARLNHHTEATAMLYGLNEGLKLILEEGLEQRFERHRVNEQALVAGIKAMGLTLFGDEASKMPTVTCISIPAGVNGEQVRRMLLDEFGIEIASSFGPLAGKIWRIGTMGYSCQKRNVLLTLGALEAVLIASGVSVHRGEAVQAALSYYSEALKEERAVL
ncbi:aminotransferase V [Alkalihalobacillus alcalophilus ATCC 27647 = CGMCC 1.3604]|uniref:Aminotransferase V n=1 Tax=Alkalihalobacillus alcalophilus ATCC 27647 = CGMCC 1.3604 TaxID=1218173 RepID=A0A094WPT6_ALKAL|nr:alanine--glyoxylate aminotransferase family protein [Alkalihalobacillus alcalophilus]KGA98816.1 aminotransferase V [Alkalihalobacillus alcalophilus ATCC 27647 = CGMCC 1.3604]MED1560999.1 alanine--glyoxylate aminotransferase family protein [Alkalihalobacillus alcalophilus]THG91555.1 aminotransferase V [Alkalihalobacillus alcalophilus ATCC 27647 = CGMCC 1.3604]